MELKPLVIGNITARVPIIQGGMGVGISLSRLAGAVAACGGIGVISAAHPGFLEEDFRTNSLGANLRALAYHIKKAKEISGGGIIGVNIMRAARDYADYVKCCAENDADIIISGAGLPIELPSLLEGTKAKYAPIVSSLKATQVLMKRWEKRNAKFPDLIVIEGPLAGGHLGFSAEYLSEHNFDNYDDEILKILEYVKEFEDRHKIKIPVVFGGGVYDRKDIDHYLSLGLSGVQIATRFVATEECDASEEFKQAYIKAVKEDIVIVKSPVGMPGRAIRNSYMKLRETARDPVSKCLRCIERCDPATTLYCITNALINAAKGNIENSLVFCGENAFRVDKMSTVKEIFDELTK